jgi:hypothetical protein
MSEEPRHAGHEGAGRPRINRWSWLLVIATVFALVATGTGCGGSSETPSEEPADSGETTIVEIAEMNYGVFEPFTVEGSGEQFIDLPVEALAGLVTATSEATDEFTIVGLDSGDQPVDLLVKEPGPYSGTTFYSDEVSGKVARLQVAGETWTVTVSPVASAPEFAGSATGTGDAVLLYPEKASALQVGHDGKRKFVVSMDGNGQGIVVETVGAHEALVEVLPGPAILLITADGGWSIEAR